MTNYKNLDAWKKSMDLIKSVYDLLKKYPKDELYALTQQTRRAAVSIPANIAEGIGRNYKKDTVQFLHIARGSLYELETLVLIAQSLEYISDANNNLLVSQIQECMRLLNGLITYFEKSDQLR